MKFTARKPLVQGLIFIVSAAVLLSLLLYLGKKYIPDAVSFTVSTSENETVCEDTAEEVSGACLYDNIFLIEQEGPYSISSEDGEIYVYSDNERLYRIKAHLSQFPLSDRDSIISGISVADKTFLYEIVQYLES